MRLPTFSSEFPASPPLGGISLTNRELGAALEDLPERERVEASQQQVVLDAVDDYYLAKRFWELSQREPMRSDSQLSMVLDHMARSLMKTAVISIAAANDAQPRTKSLHGLLNLLAAKADDETSPEGDRTDAREAIAILQSWIDPNENEALRYVRFLRNKWAGHASFDRQFDTWAGTGESVSLPHVEEALVTLVNAHELLAQLLNKSALPSGLAQEPASPLVDGARSVPMTIKWAAVETFAGVMRLSNEQAVGHLGDLLEEAVAARLDR